MTYPRFLRCIPLFCAAFMLAACSDAGDSKSAVSKARQFFHSFYMMSPNPPEQSPRPMVGFRNLGDTCYANSALKFLIHSIGPRRLQQHLGEFAADSDHLHREAAQHLRQLIANSHLQETGPAQDDLSNFLASLQKLPAFSSRNAAGELNFPIVGRLHDADDFLLKLSDSLALHRLHANTMALKDDLNAFKNDEEYWTILQPASAHDSLQDVFDRSASWQVKPGPELRQLTVRMDNTVDDGQGLRLLGTWNFDFNQTVRLRAVEGNRTMTLTLEPREVIECLGTDSTGHYVVYAKDSQWIRYDDEQVTVLDRMPAIENALLINFAIKKLEIESSSGFGRYPSRNAASAHRGAGPGSGNSVL